MTHKTLLERLEKEAAIFAALDHTHAGPQVAELLREAAARIEELEDEVCELQRVALDGR